MTALIEVSFGELIDKITILEIKSARIEDPIKSANIRTELEALTPVWERCRAPILSTELEGLRGELKQVNERLWEIEDAIRAQEQAKTFNAAFIELARSVYLTNDERARLKKRIDGLLGSRFSEEKSYQSY